MRVFLAGATGAIGRRLIPRFLDAGHEVTGTTRTTSRARELRQLGAEPAIADGLDMAAMRQAVCRRSGRRGAESKAAAALALSRGRRQSRASSGPQPHTVAAHALRPPAPSRSPVPPFAAASAMRWGG